MRQVDVSYVLDLAASLKPKDTVVVLGHEQKLVKKEIPPKIKTAIQSRLLGTADAVRVGLSKLSVNSGSVLILYADVPLLTKEALLKLIKRHFEGDAEATLLTADVSEPKGYGRVLGINILVSAVSPKRRMRTSFKEISRRLIPIMCFNIATLKRALTKVKRNNKKRSITLRML